MAARALRRRRRWLYRLVVLAVLLAGVWAFRRHTAEATTALVLLCAADFGHDVWRSRRRDDAERVAAASRSWVEGGERTRPGQRLP